MKWTEKEEVFLAKNYEIRSIEELSNMLGRSKKSVAQKAYFMGIRLSSDEKKHRHSLAGLKTIASRNGNFNSDNPNWKNGISKNNYHYKKIQKERYPLRVKARHIAFTAFSRGKLTKKPCEICGSFEDVQAHHEDYSKPLDVTWLCRECHRELHKTLAVNKSHESAVI